LSPTPWERRTENTAAASVEETMAPQKQAFEKAESQQGMGDETDDQRGDQYAHRREKQALAQHTAHMLPFGIQSAGEEDENQRQDAMDCARRRSSK